MMGRQKKWLPLFFSFTFPLSHARLSFSLSLASLWHKESFAGEKEETVLDTKVLFYTS